LTSYATTAGIVSERYAEEVTLSSAQANLDNADNDWTISLPAGFGDCLILEASYRVTSIETFAATNVGLELGIEGSIVDASGVQQDFLGSGRGSTIGINAARGVAVDLKPDQPVRWNQSENLFLRLGEIDVGASDLSDAYVMIRVRRLRTPV